MIKGTGIDIVDIDRMEAIVKRYGDLFLNKIFTKTEIAYCASTPVATLRYAGRWAVKEAFYKALPASCQKVCFWKSIEVVTDHTTGAPSLSVCSEQLKTMMKNSGIDNTFISLSHEKKFCIAFAVLE